VSVLARSAIAEGVGGPHVEDVTDRLRLLRRRSALLGLKRDRVVALLADAGVRPVLLKGAGLALTAYAEPCERDLADLDILIREDDLEQSLRTLRAVGYTGPSSPGEFTRYRRRHFHIHLRHPDADIVEIHWGLTMPSSPFRLDASEVVSQSVPLERPGQPLLLVSRPEHTLLHLVLQNLQEGHSRLSRFVDIDRIIASSPGLDWQDLVETARKGNLGPATAVSLQLAARLLGAEVPAAVARELRPGALASVHLAMMRPVRALLSRRFTRVHVAPLLHEFWLLSGFRQRLGHVRRGLTAEATFASSTRDRVGFLGGFLKLIKLIGLQVVVYAGATLALLTTSGRKELSFWRMPSDSPRDR
jgi:hypothetical protein